MTDQKNPFADSDGLPLDGKSSEFYQWAKDRAKEDLNKLPAAEQKEVIAAEKELNKRMDS